MIRIYDFQGVIDHAANGVGPQPGPIQTIFGDLSLLQSQPMTGYFSYDTAAADLFPWPDGGQYRLPQGDSFDFLIDGKTVSPAAGGFAEVDCPGGVVWVYSLGDVTIEGTALGTPSQMAVRFVSPTPLQDASMPEHLSLDNFKLATGLVTDGCLTIGFTVKSLTERVPLAPPSGLRVSPV